jgi:hypothetical protein
MACHDVLYVEPPRNAVHCDDISACSLSAVFATAAEELSRGRCGLIWVHSQGLKLPWDAPAELRRRFMDPEDPDPPMEVGPPDLRLRDDSDPDILTGWGQVAAAQTAVLDHALSVLQDVVANRADASRFAWVLATLGGVALGENQYIGLHHPRLHSEQLRMVAMLRPATKKSGGSRLGALYQLPDLCPSILELLGEQLPDDQQLWGQNCLGMGVEFSPEYWPRSHQLAVTHAAQRLWVRCPAWNAQLESGQTVRLFVKPDDRWEVTEVANRRADVCQQIEACHAAFLAAAQANQRGAWPELSEELTSLLR